MYNPWITTNPRIKTNKSFNEGATAGAAKSPTSVATMSKAELQELGARYGWNSEQQLTMSYLQSCGSAEYRFHELCNESFSQAFDRDANKRASDDNVAAGKVKRMWNGHSTPEEDAKASAVANEFCNRYVQFARTLENARIMARWMEENNLDATRLDSYVQAFETLVAEGKLTVRDGDTELSGEALKNSARLRILLQPISKPLPPEESADAFYARTKELHPGKPFMIRQREAKAQATAEHFTTTEENTARAGITQVVTYDDEPTGYPAAPTRYSFRKLLDSLDSQAYAKRIREDGQFAAAVDKLTDGNK